MAKQTLLAIVQDLLSDMSSDTVNTISDTQEAEDLARIVRRAYWDIVEELGVPANRDILTLEAAATAEYPTLFRIPDAVSRLLWFKYADLQGDLLDEKRYYDVTYKEPADWLALVLQNSSTDDDIQNVNWLNMILPIRTDKNPQYWTSFDDEYIWVDSWDSSDSSTVVANNSLCYGERAPTFTILDDFIPDLPANLFPYLYATAKTRAFADIKQSVNPKAEQIENRLRIRSQRNKHRATHQIVPSPNYGRK